MDNATEKNKRLDVVRCLVRTTSLETINKVVQVMINDHIFSIKMEEEAYMCPIVMQTHGQFIKGGSDEES